MSLTTLLSIFFLVAVCVIPFLVVAIQNKKADRQLLGALTRYSATRGYSLNCHDICGKQAIGLSADGNTLLFLKRVADEDQIQEIDLTQIGSCRLNKVTRSNVDGNYIVVHRVALQFIFSDSSRPDVILELYNQETDNLSVADELQFAVKWQALVENRNEKS